MLKTRLIGFHFPRHEDETGHAEAEADDGDVFNAVFEDDVDGAVVVGRVGRVPEVDPVVVHLRDR